VYNSNAIENSTLTLKETEQIIAQEMVKRPSLREIYEARNLAKIAQFKEKGELSKDLILIWHKTLLTDIDDFIAGRFRVNEEYVRVGYYIAPAPEHLDLAFTSFLTDYQSNFDGYFLDKITKFHLEFENLHPFNDGNGRIGRVIINYQLAQLGFPPIIIRGKEKVIYGKTFGVYRETKNIKPLLKIITLALLESFHKRLAYLEGKKIITLSDYVKSQNKSAPAVFNAAKRQSIPAFRQRGVWKIGV
ncbi:MAG: Fic family protein, partial [bacterium]|nr:Fic family protein [bacterium]